MSSHLPPNHVERMQRVAIALDGLSVGDALGEQFFAEGGAALLVRRTVPDPYWFYTDDTEMALGIAHVLDRFGSIDQDELAKVFAQRHQRNPLRGYGATAHQILAAISTGKSWQAAARNAFFGEGSMGNGAAMRVAPVGAYWAEDYAETARQAIRSAEVTHAHPEGIAGAVAVAVAAAWAWRQGRSEELPGTMLQRVLDFTPDGTTRSGIEHALQIVADTPIETVARKLGNGSRVTAPDTVPFALWCAARHSQNFEQAIWSAISAWGDIDTNCAIVGGIIALTVGRAGIPQAWLNAREELT